MLWMPSHDVWGTKKIASLQMALWIKIPKIYPPFPQLYHLTAFFFVGFILLWCIIIYNVFGNGQRSILLLTAFAWLVPINHDAWCLQRHVSLNVDIAAVWFGWYIHWWCTLKVGRWSVLTTPCTFLYVAALSVLYWPEWNVKHVM